VHYQWTEQVVYHAIQSRNLHNLEIALRIPRITKLCANLEIAPGFMQSRDCMAPVHNVEIAQFLLRAQLNPSSFYRI